MSPTTGPCVWTKNNESAPAGRSINQRENRCQQAFCMNVRVSTNMPKIMHRKATTANATWIVPAVDNDWASARLSMLSVGTNATRTDAKPLTPTNSEPTRSEEHTSELQSRFDLVCRLLL